MVALVSQPPDSAGACPVAPALNAFRGAAACSAAPTSWTSWNQLSLSSVEPRWSTVNKLSPPGLAEEEVSTDDNVSRWPEEESSWTCPEAEIEGPASLEDCLLDSALLQQTPLQDCRQGPIHPQEEPAKAEPICSPSAGSVGHPFHCGLPCRFFWRKVCKDGASCTRCHQCEWKSCFAKSAGQKHKKDFVAMGPKPSNRKLLAAPPPVDDVFTPKVTRPFPVLAHRAAEPVESLGTFGHDMGACAMACPYVGTARGCPHGALCGMCHRCGC